MKCEVNACGARLVLVGVNPNTKRVQVVCQDGHKSEYEIMPEWWSWAQELAIKADNMSVTLGMIPNPARSMLTTEVYEIAAMAVLAARVRPEEPKNVETPKEEKEIFTLKIYTDGSCHPNPGPGGCGFIIKNGDETIVRMSVPAQGDVSNNVAEYMGVREALKHAAQLVMVPAQLDHIVIYSDSELMVKQLRDEYAVGKNLADSHDAAMDLINKFADRGTAVTIEWIPGESNPAHELAEAAYHEAKRLRSKK
jgi:ribonuclease HI